MAGKSSSGCVHALQKSLFCTIPYKQYSQTDLDYFIYLKTKMQIRLKVCFCFFFFPELLKWISEVEMCWTTGNGIIVLLYLTRNKVHNATIFTRPCLADAAGSSVHHVIDTRERKRQATACDLHTHCQHFPFILPPCAQHAKNLQRTLSKQLRTTCEFLWRL